jgi:hypothetical protein
MLRILRLPLALVIVLLPLAIPANAAISLTQHNSTDAGTVTSAPLAFTSNNTLHNFIVVCIRIGATGATITVSDTQTNTYASALQFNDTGGGNTVAIVYALDIKAGANTVTVSFSGVGSQTLRFSIAEYSGVALTSALDVTNSNQANSAALDSGNVTTTANGELIVGIMVNANGKTWTVGTGYTSEEQVPTTAGTSKLMFEDRIQTSAGVISASATIDSSDPWSAGIATFKSASITCNNRILLQGAGCG